MPTSPCMRPGRIAVRCDCIACAWLVKYDWTVWIADDLVGESLMGNELIGMSDEAGEELLVDGMSAGLCIDGLIGGSLTGNELIGVADEARVGDWAGSLGSGSELSVRGSCRVSSIISSISSIVPEESAIREEGYETLLSESPQG